MGAAPCDLLDQPEETDTGDAGVECGQDVCANFLAVEVIRADNESFFDGFYGFEVATSDGSQYSLECSFAGYGATLDCSYGDLSMLGALMDGGSQSIAITFLDTPATATFTVTYNDWAIGERTFTPQYEEILPNGPECEPVCYQAEETMAVESW